MFAWQIGRSEQKVIYRLYRVIYEDSCVIYDDSQVIVEGHQTPKLSIPVSCNSLLFVLRFLYHY